MQSYGNDRVRPGKDGQWILTCQRQKGWTPRVAKTLTTAQHPGTAVLWDEQYFEVVTAESPAAGVVRYVLEPWSDAHTMRITDAYDAASEVRRDEEHRKLEAREKGRRAGNVLAVLTGHLPAVVQEHLASETGLVATRMTMLSLLLTVGFDIYVGLHAVSGILDPRKPPTPLWMAALALYLLVENIIRINIVLAHNRPIGSALGFFGYIVFWTISGKRLGAPSPFAVPKGSAVVITDAPVDVALRDAYTMREPLLTLLTPEEQHFLAARFGFDYRKHSAGVIAVILLMTSAGVVTSLMSLDSRGPSLSALSSLVLAIALGGEQIYRLIALKHGPTGSFLAVLVRPVVAKLFVTSD